jgi:uroporphyrinogen decarboxylase
VTSRERVLAALTHRVPDRIPLDLGGTLATTMTGTAYRRLRTHLSMEDAGAVRIFSKRSGTVIPDEGILERFHADCRAVLLGDPDINPDRQLDGGTLVDEWGVTWLRPESGHYIPIRGPFSNLDAPDLAALDHHRWPDPSDPGRYRGLRERAQSVHEATSYATVLNLGVGPVHLCQYLRGYGEWLMDLIERPTFAEALLDVAASFHIEVATRALHEAAPFVDVVCFGDDIGTQQRPLVRPDLYRRMIKPRHRRIVDAVKRFGKPLIYHSCGAIYPLLPDLVDLGIDALNPVQVSAAGMDTARLKREFGSWLTFWGGVDTQVALSRGTVEDVRREVRRRIDDFAGDGGYVLCAVHNIQSEVPPENVVAMFEAALEYGHDPSAVSASTSS